MGPLGDQDGDGSLDLVLGGSDAYGAYADYGVLVFSGGSGFSGDMDPDDASFQLTDSGYQYAYYGYGVSVNGATDVNGDGTDEIVVGSSYDYYYEAGVGYVYSSYLYIADPTGLSGATSLEDVDFVADADSNNERLGARVAGEDVDGDGYGDVFVGAPGNSEGGSGAGAVYMILGSSSFGTTDSIEDVYDLKITGNNGDGVGLGDILIEDLDGDGTYDLALGVPNDESAVIFWDVGTLADTDTSTADVTINSSSADPDYFGTTLAAGDFDGDGNTDLAVSAPDYVGSYVYYVDDIGTVFLFDNATLTGTVSTSSADGSIEGNSGSLFGLGMHAVDLDADGADDLAISAPGEGSGGSVYFMTLQ